MFHVGLILLAHRILCFSFTLFAAALIVGMCVSREILTASVRTWIILCPYFLRMELGFLYSWLTDSGILPRILQDFLKVPGKSILVSLLVIIEK